MFLRVLERRLTRRPGGRRGGGAKGLMAAEGRGEGRVGGASAPTTPGIKERHQNVRSGNNWLAVLSPASRAARRTPNIWVKQLATTFVNLVILMQERNF